MARITFIYFFSNKVSSENSLSQLVSACLFPVFHDPSSVHMHFCVLIFSYRGKSHFGLRAIHIISFNAKHFFVLYKYSYILKYCGLGFSQINLWWDTTQSITLSLLNTQSRGDINLSEYNNRTHDFVGRELEQQILSTEYHQNCSGGTNAYIPRMLNQWV